MKILLLLMRQPQQQHSKYLADLLILLMIIEDMTIQSKCQLTTGMMADSLQSQRLSQT